MNSPSYCKLLKATKHNVTFFMCELFSMFLHSFKHCVVRIVRNYMCHVQLICLICIHMFTPTCMCVKNSCQMKYFFCFVHVCHWNSKTRVYACFVGLVYRRSASFFHLALISLGTSCHLLSVPDLKHPSLTHIVSHVLGESEQEHSA